MIFISGEILNNELLLWVNGPKIPDGVEFHLWEFVSEVLPDILHTSAKDKLKSFMSRCPGVKVCLRYTAPHSSDPWDSYVMYCTFVRMGSQLCFHIKLYNGVPDEFCSIYRILSVCPEPLTIIKVIQAEEKERRALLNTWRRDITMPPVNGFYLCEMYPKKEFPRSIYGLYSGESPEYLSFLFEGALHQMGCFTQTKYSLIPVEREEMQQMARIAKACGVASIFNPEPRDFFVFSN